MAPTRDDHYSHCEAMLRERDRDLWLASLFAPEPARKHIHAIYAFAQEAADAPRKVTQPLLGEMRLRWWADVIMSEAHAAEAARAHPVADALLNSIEHFDIPREDLVALVEAHIFDLAEDQMQTLEALEDYCRSTVAAPMRCAARILGAPESKAFEEAGIALGLTKIMRSPLARRAIPIELSSRHGDEALRGAFAALAETAQARYEAARGHAATLATGREALLPAATIPLYLEKMARERDPLRSCADVSPLRRQWRLWRAAHGVGL